MGRKYCSVIAKDAQFDDHFGHSLVETQYSQGCCQFENNSLEGIRHG